MTFPPVSTPLLPPLLPSPPKRLPLPSAATVLPVTTPPTPPLPPVPPLPPSSLSSFYGHVSTGPSCSCSCSSSSSPSLSSSFLKYSNYCLMTFLNILSTNNYDNLICCYTENITYFSSFSFYWNMFNLRSFLFLQR